MTQSRKVYIVLLLLFTAACLAGLCFGTQCLSPVQVIQQLLSTEKSSVLYRILMMVRIPRLAGGLLAGCALALSGAILQNVLDNPLASGNIIGVNAGAGFAITFLGAFFPLSGVFVPAAAFLGALLAVGIILLLAIRTEASRMTVILAGVAVSAMFTAGTEAIIAIVPDAVSSYSQFRIGSLANLTMKEILPAGVLILLACIVTQLLADEMDVLMLGDESAQSLGMNVRRVRILLLVVAALLSAAAVSYAGMIGFVGLIIPQVLRRFLKEGNRVLLPACMLAGSSFLVLCDTASRTLFAPYEMPVGVLLSLCGGPFFLYLLLKKKGGRHA